MRLRRPLGRAPFVPRIRYSSPGFNLFGHRIRLQALGKGEGKGGRLTLAGFELSNGRFWLNEKHDFASPFISNCPGWFAAWSARLTVAGQGLLGS
jgi:hypothetical protein